MAKKTQPSLISVTEYLQNVTPDQKRKDSIELDALFRRVTGFEPVMWGPTIVGYGKYHYKYKTGREGDSLATGFAPRKTSFSVYIMPGYADFSDELARLGKHKIGKSCLYFNKLADIDTNVLTEMIEVGITRLDGFWPVTPT